jgi:hypothetical protein
MATHALSNARHELFALQVALGMMAVDAYLAAFRTKGMKRSVATVCASKLLRSAKVEARVSELRAAHFAQVSKDGFLSLEEKRRGLADIWRCKLSECMDEDGNLIVAKVRALPAWCIQKWRVVETTTFRGKKVVTKIVRRTAELELTDKLRAVTVDNELLGLVPPSQGDESPEEQNARRKRAFALLRTLPGHGGHLLPAIEAVEA